MKTRLTACLTILGLIGLMIVGLSVDWGTVQAVERSAKKGKAAGQPANFDALSTFSVKKRAAERSGGRDVQFEERFGVPTFIWATDPGPASPMRRSAQGKRLDQVAAARGHLGRYLSQYGLSKTGSLNEAVDLVHDTGQGAIIVSFKQQVGDLEVFRDRVNVIMNRNLQLIAISGFLNGDASKVDRSALSFRFGGDTAVIRAIADLTGEDIGTSAIMPVSAKNADPADPYTRFTPSPKAEPQTFAFGEEPSRSRPVLFHLPGRLVPAYYVETSVLMPSDSTTILANTGASVPEEWAYGYVISAEDGSVLFRKNLVAEQSFTYRVYADPTTKIPYDTPAGNAVHPNISATPDGAQYPFLPAQDITLVSYPFSQNDPWLAAGATETVGNNADAFLNLFSPDGYGTATTTTPTDFPTGDFRAQLSGPGAFLHSHPGGTATWLAEARQGSIQQLFYNINFLHDWYYDAGFNEVSRNAQVNNYGRGGLGGDDIKSQVQDFAGFSNANMLTPADGSRPRMRMYVFPSISNVLDVTSSATIGKRGIGISMSGPQNFDVTSDIVIATFSNSPSSCTITNAAALDGKIAMFDFDNTDGTGCSFSTRLTRLMSTNAAAIVMVYTSSNAAVVANITGFVTTNTKPVSTISWNSGTLIKTELAVPNTVTARLYRAPDRDGTLDNQIVFHEWGHYISNRLIGNGSGLNTNMSGGLGEGWGDFNALMLTVRADDTATTSNATWNGAYALATYATSGVNPLGVGNAGYYFGIRRAPYSTDLNINPLTFRHIANGQTIPAGPPISFGSDGASNAEVHNTGEVWANMLWECYASLLRDTQGASPRLTFDQAQNRMKNYLVAAFKATPLSPTLTEARDAVLAAAFANDPVDGALFGAAFAKRGAGIGAVAPDRFSSTNVGVIESFAVRGDISVVSASIDDSVTSIDNDGYLDSGETGMLKVTIKNTGVAPLSAATSTVTSSSASVSFPSGNTINFPAIGALDSGSASIPVALGPSGPQDVTFTITTSDPTVPNNVVTTISDYLNVSELTAASRTDNVEPHSRTWSITSNPALSQLASSQFRRTTGSPVNFHWFVPDIDGGSDQYLTSVPVTINRSGSLNLQFDHSYSFEFDSGGNYDGGVVEMSVNGGAWTDIGTSAYNGTLVTYSGNVNPLAGRPAFVRSSGGTLHASLTQAVAAGSVVQIRFRAASDGGVGADGWHIDNISLSGVVGAPFNVLVGDYTASGTATISGRVTSAGGQGVSKATVTVRDAHGFSRSAITNTFGYYVVSVPTTGAYAVQASSRRVAYGPPQVVVAEAAVANVNFTEE